jgi:PTH2 family peptidyl-tRNA hydrolase
MAITDLFLLDTFKAAERSQVILITTTFASFFTGFLLGIYSIRGYLISPELAAERRGNYTDPVESEESDVDEDDTILDHAPNWSNGEEADRKQGLRAPKEEVKKKADKEAKEVKKAAAKEEDIGNPNEDCKLVLVVRTDLGMTKGRFSSLLLVAGTGN